MPVLYNGKIFLPEILVPIRVLGIRLRRKFPIQGLNWTTELTVFGDGTISSISLVTDTKSPFSFVDALEALSLSVTIQ